jgi:hypothetical protein
LIRLDVRRVVVRLDLERDGIALADVDHAGVLTDTGERLAEGSLLGKVTELLEVHLGGLVGAVLAPHHGVHRQLCAGRPATEDLADAVVLVGLESELRPRLGLVGGGCCYIDGVQAGGFGHTPILSVSHDASAVGQSAP